MNTWSWKKWVFHSLMLGSLLFAFSKYAPSEIRGGVLWGIGLGVALFIVGLVWFLIARFGAKRGRAPATKGKAALAPAPSLREGVFIDTLLNGFVGTQWVLLVFGAALVSPSVTPNWTWIPFGAWAVVVFVTRARNYSQERSPGKDKPDPGLEKLSMRAKGFAVFATLAVALYYSYLAPDGTWEKLTKKSDAHSPSYPSEMFVPKGVPLNPSFTSTMLASWDVIYVVTNPQYRHLQAKWHGKKVTLREKPGREVADVVDLTLGMGEASALDIHLSGACQATMDDRRRLISKTCVGWWKDLGGQISGQFYLEVTEGGSGRYFDVYLYSGNNLPKKSELQMFLSGPPIPAVMLQFRPKGSREDQ